MVQQVKDPALQWHGSIPGPGTFTGSGHSQKKKFQGVRVDQKSWSFYFRAVRMKCLLSLSSRVIQNWFFKAKHCRYRWEVLKEQPGAWLSQGGRTFEELHWYHHENRSSRSQQLSKTPPGLLHHRHAWAPTIRKSPGQLSGAYVPRPACPFPNKVFPHHVRGYLKHFQKRRVKRQTLYT